MSKGYWPINYENANAFQIPKELEAIFNEYSISNFPGLYFITKLIYSFNIFPFTNNFFSITVLLNF